MRVEAELHNLIQSEAGTTRVELNSHTLLQRSPVTRSQCLTTQILDQRDGLAELIQLAFHGLPHAPFLYIPAQLAHALGEDSRRVLQLLHIEILELAVLPLVPIVIPLDSDVPDLRQKLHIAGERSQVGMLGRWDREDGQPSGQRGLALLSLGDLGLVRFDDLQRMFGLDLVVEGKIHVRGLTQLSHL